MVSCMLCLLEGNLFFGGIKIVPIYIDMIGIFLHCICCALAFISWKNEERTKTVSPREGLLKYIQ